jgi:predicted SprT family Zn-dependent metalloprotease
MNKAEQIIAQIAKHPLAKMPTYKEFKALSNRQKYKALNQVAAALNNIVHASKQAEAGQNGD